MKNKLLLDLDTSPYTEKRPIDNSEYIIGPPGTGKTTEVISRMETLLMQGVLPHQMSYISFTNSMADDGVRRLNLTLDKSSQRQYGTLHSICLKQLMQTNSRYKHIAIKLRPLAGNIKKFLGYCPSLMSGDPDEPKMHTVVNAYRKYRSSLGADPLSTKENDFAAAYRRAVQVTGALDYHDMLLVAAYERLTIPADYIFVDEAQDLSPLMIETIRALTRNAKQVVFALDDDQSMYEFMGAEPSFWVSTAEGRTTVLHQSYRVPQAAHKAAVELISRNRHRVEKEYLPKNEEGSVTHYREPLEAIHDCAKDKGVILARTNKILNTIAKQADTLGYFYASSRGSCGPFDLGGEGNMVINLLYSGERHWHTSLNTLHDFMQFVKVRGKNAPPEFKNLLPSQAKSPIKKLITSVGGETLIPLNRAALGELYEGRLVYLADLFSFLYAQEQPHRFLTGLPEEFSRRLDMVMSKYGKIPEPDLHLSTFHSFKGLEHHSIYVCADIGPKAEVSMTDKVGYEIENRAMYVALTRTSDKLGIIHGQVCGGHMFRGMFS